jgi:hypothetical protein
MPIPTLEEFNAETDRLNTIHVYVRGGVIQDIDNIPEGVTVKVFDYDIDGADDDRLSKDENGKDCHLGIWEGR